MVKTGLGDTQQLPGSIDRIVIFVASSVSFLLFSSHPRPRHPSRPSLVTVDGVGGGGSSWLWRWGPVWAGSGMEFGGKWDLGARG